MKPQSCKNKGRRLQKYVASTILQTFPHLTTDDCFSTSMGAPGEDIRMSTAARASIPFSFECKNVERINIWACIEQCKSNSGPHVPCLVFSRNKSETWACLPWQSLLELVKASQNGRVPPRIRDLVNDLMDALNDHEDKTTV